MQNPPNTSNRRRNLSVVARAAVAATLLLAACGDDGGEEGSDPTTTTEAVDDGTTTTTERSTEDEGSDGEVDPLGAVTVEVIDAGEEPRRELRVAVEPGTEHPVTTRMRQEISIDVRGQTQETASATEQAVVYVVDSVEDGVISVTTKYQGGRVLDDVAIDPATRRGLEEVLGLFEDAEGSATYDQRGALISLVPPSLEGAPPQIAPALETMIDSMESQAAQMSVPFPEEPVGVGAVWRVSASLDMAGLPFEIVTEVALTEVSDTEVSGTIDQTLTIVPGPVEVQGVAAEVVEGEMAGGGTISWPLDRPVALTTQELDGTVVMRFEDPSGEKIELTQRLYQSIELLAK